MEKTAPLFENVTRFSEKTGRKSIRKVIWQATKASTVLKILLCTYYAIAVIFIIWLLVENWGMYALVIFGIVPLLILVVLGIIFLCGLLLYNQFFKAISIGNHRLKDMEGDGIFYCVGNESMLINTTKGKASISFSQIETIIENNDVLILILDNTFLLFGSTLIAKDGFTKGTYEDFCEHLKNESGATWK